MKVNTSRLQSLDALRGMMIVVMALDHANGLIARGRLASEMWAGDFPDYQGDALAFLTRFVTHLAAPGFFFLMGAGMALLAASRRAQGWSRSEVARFFALRGLLLIALQFILENPAWRLGNLGPPENITYVGVLFALGAGMLLGSLFIFLPKTALFIISAALVLSTEFLLPDPGTFAGGYPFLQTLLMVPGYGPLIDGGLWVLYPALPWLGVVGLGMAFGQFLERDPEKTLANSAWAGLLGLTLFSALRLSGVYGNIRPAAGDSWIDYFNLVKYPPGLVFLAFMLGANFLLLALFSRLDKTRPAWNQRLAVFGRVPLFFYIAHLYLYALAGRRLAPNGVPIPGMVPFWLLGLAILYPLCQWYGTFKRSRPAGSFWRLL